MSTPRLDPITERVVANALHSICEEMGHTMIRTANSGIFVEGRDFSCAVVGPDAELVATANYDPSHLSAMALTVEFTLLYFGYDNIKSGDVYLVNDPYRGGGHLPDIALIRPVFHNEVLLGFAVNRAHHIDIGGMAVAGFPGTARSIYQEGLRIPPVRWFVEGKENLDVIEMITLNQRFSADQLGDFRAQLASAHAAEQRLRALAERYGADTVIECMEQTKRHSEQLVRAVLRDLPDGTYEFDEFVEDDGVTDIPYRIHVAVTIHGDSITVDYTGTSPQAAGPINSSYGNTLSGTFNALLQLVGPDVPFNHGCFRPVEVVAPRGCLLNPVPPAPCFGGVTEVCIRIIDVVLGALAPVARDRAGAGSYGTCINFSGGGFDRERGESFGFYFFVEGGWGACNWRDGWNCTPNPTSNFNDYPVEWTESELPLRYHEVSLNKDSGGPGRKRGGVGTIRTIEILVDDVEINALGERFKVAPYGLDGGLPGGTNGIYIKQPGAEAWQSLSDALNVTSPSKFHNVRGGQQVMFRIVTGGGGGYGDPLAREPEAVVDDVASGFVSHEGALQDYGVALKEHSDGRLGFDPEATRAARSKMVGLVPERLKTHRACIAEAHARSMTEVSKPEVLAGIEKAATIIDRAKRQIAKQGISDAHSKAGRSLRNPFLNELAMKFWDAYALERWMARNEFSIER